MFCKKCGSELNNNQPCQNCQGKLIKNKTKSFIKDAFAVSAYLIFFIFAGLSWGIRRDFIVGPIPVVIHLGILYLIYVLIRKILK